MPEIEKIPRPNRIADLTGQRFGSWTVRGYIGRNKLYQSFWSVLCDCGEGAIVQQNHLKHGKSTCCRTCQGKKTRNRMKKVHWTELLKKDSDNV